MSYTFARNAHHPLACKTEMKPQGYPQRMYEMYTVCFYTFMILFNNI